MTDAICPRQPVSRRLIVAADDYAIGPATSRGILELAADGLVTSAVLLTNGPYVEEAVANWKSAGGDLEMGWHPCLTLDGPILPAGQTKSLVNRRGQFHGLGAFLGRLLTGRINRDEVRAELAAQLDRYRQLMGADPPTVNAHHHLHVFAPIAEALADVLATCKAKPFVRRVREPHGLWRTIPGARLKRAALSLRGSSSSRLFDRAGYPGADWLLGVTDPPFVADPRFFVRWVEKAPGSVVELAVHPGHYDATLVGRDCPKAGAALDRRVFELALLRHPSFMDAVARAGFALSAASRARGTPRHAA